jgi:hypothetical protein
MTLQPTSSTPIAVPCEHGALLLIEPPEGWLMAPPVPPARLYLLDPNAPGPFRPNLNVVVQELGKLTPEDYVQLTRLQLKALGDGAVVERDQPLGPARTGHLFEVVFHGGPVTVCSRQVILLHAGSAYVLTAMAAADEFRAYRARFEKALESVTIRLGSGS